MSDLLSAMRSAALLSSKARREALLPLANGAELSRAVNALAAGQDAETLRLILRSLSDLSQNRETGEHIRRLFSIKKDELLPLFSCPDAKVRKNLAELLGRLDADLYSSALVSALRAENTDFVKPSILLALGNAKNSPPALEALRQFAVPDSSDKNIRAQQEALQKALASLSGKSEAALPVPLKTPGEVLLLCPNARITAQELSSLGFSAKALSTRDNLTLASGVTDFLALYQARTFYSAGLLVSSSPDFSADRKKLLAAVENLYGTLSLRYRLDVRGEEVTQELRAEVRKNLLSLLAGSPLQNSPSDYDFELVCLCTYQKNHFVLFPGSRTDGRFDYKKEAVAASIHPAVAASCVYFMKDDLSPAARVLDPFCGSGTMLFERGRLPHRTLTGTDISPLAIKAAKLNKKNAGLDMSLFVKNALTPFKEQYDEVISNLPFGLRVASHSANQKLYSEFLQNLRGILAPGGTAFLFTNDKKLLANLYEKDYELKGKANFSAGGLFPTLYILKPR